MPDEKFQEMKLQEWINTQTVDDKMLWKGAFGDQMQFFRDTATRLFCWGMDYEDTEDIATVISTHRSKSITLPVFKLHRGDVGLTILARNNFYDWKMSVISKIPIHANFDGIFYTTPPIEPNYTGDPLNTVYFEGFPKKYVFGYHRDNKKQFSAEIGTNHMFFTAIFLILRDRGIAEGCQWHTKESHRRELDAAAARRKVREEREKTP